MSLEFIDGFDHYAIGDILTKWHDGAAAGASIISGARNSGNGLKLGSSADWVAFYGASKATRTIGFAYRQTTNRPSSASNILELRDGSVLHVALRANTDGTFSILRNTTVLASSTATTTAGTFAYYELKVTVDDTVGAYELRQDGVNILSATGQDTRNAGNATFDYVRLIGTGHASGGFDLWDDVYILNTDGSVNTSFLGDSRVATLFPVADGNTIQLTPSAGANHDCVDEASVNGDTDYVSGTTATNKDTYGMQDMPHNPTSIYGVQVCVSSRREDVGLKTSSTVVRSGGSDTNGSSQGVFSEYRMTREILETDPATSSAWLYAGVNAMEAGLRIVS